MTAHAVTTQNSRFRTGSAAFNRHALLVIWIPFWEGEKWAWSHPPAGR